MGNFSSPTSVVVERRCGVNTAGDAGVRVDVSPDITGTVKTPAVSCVNALDVSQPTVVAVCHFRLVRSLQSRTAACCTAHNILHTKRRYVCGLPMAGRTAGLIKTKLGMGTHVDPRSVSVKVKVKVIYACGIIESMPATPGEQQ